MRFLAAALAILTCTLASFILLPSSGHATTLLGTISFSASGGTSSASYTQVSRIAFEFGHDGGILGPPCTNPRVGCEGKLIASVRRNSEFTFDAFNSQYFPLVAAALSNGVAEPVYFAQRFFSAEGAMLFASGQGGSPENVAFGVTSDFAGYTITSITVTVSNFALNDMATLCGGQPGGLCYRADLVWRFYGIETSTPAPGQSWGSLKAHYR